MLNAQSQPAKLSEFRAALSNQRINCIVTAKPYGCRLRFPVAGHCLAARKLAKSHGFTDLGIEGVLVPLRNSALDFAEFEIKSDARPAK